MKVNIQNSQEKALIVEKVDACNPQETIKEKRSEIKRKNLTFFLWVYNTNTQRTTKEEKGWFQENKNDVSFFSISFQF